MAFITIQSSFVGHVLLHVGSLLALCLFFLGTNLVLLRARRAAIDFWIWAYDVVALLFDIVYGVVLLMYSDKEDLPITAISVMAYVTIFLQFARFPVNGWQVLPSEFVIPFWSQPKV
jgi:hypothetical protein